MEPGTHAQGADAEPRCAARTNMFVVATIYAGDASAPVKIRNLSRTGALIEGARLPPVGTKISLRRGSLHAGGEVVWSGNGRAGIKLDAPASVAHWLPGGEALLQQEQVDAIFQEIKASGASSLPARDPLPSTVTAEEVGKVVALLGELAESLSDDADVVARHGVQMQALDLAAQMLGKLSPKAG